MTACRWLPRWGGSLLAFAVAAALFAVHGVGQVEAVLPAGTTTGWNSLIDVFASAYFIGMVALPAMLVASAAAAPAATTVERVLRYGSRTRAALHFALTRTLAAVPFLGVWLMVDVATAARYGWRAGWGPAATAGRSANLVFPDLVERFAPQAAVIAQFTLLLAAAWVCAAATGVIAVWSVGQRLLRWACAAIVLWTWVAFKLPLQAVPDPVKPMTYLTVHLGTSAGLPLAVIVAVSVGVGVALLMGSLLAEQLRLRLRFRPDAVSSFAVWALVTGPALLGLESLRRPWTQGEDGLVVVFFGFSAERLDVLGSMMQLLLTVGPAVALHVRFTGRLQEGAFEELIRCRSTLHWWWRVSLRPGIVTAVLVPAGALGIHGAVSGLHGAAPALGGRALAFFLVVTSVQILVAVVLFSAVTLVSGDVTAGVWLVGAALVAAIPAIFRLGFLPFGLSSMSLHWSGASVLHVAGVLTIWGSVALAVTAWSTRVRGLQIL